MKYIELFGGIGGFSEGIRRTNPLARCVAYYEWDKYAVQTYNKNNKTNYEPTDITKLSTKDIPDHDLLCGGFPCQSFSVAGKRKGFEDTRGTMFFEICRIIKDKKPRLLWLENVKGLFSHDKGRTFATILYSLYELGYDVQWQCLNSKLFGVPQNRERVFIIGHLRGTSRPKIFPIGQGSEKINQQQQRISFPTVFASQHKIARGMPMIQQLNNPTHSGMRVYSEEGISPALNTAQGGNRQPKIVERAPLKFLDRNQKKIEGDYAFTIDSANTGGVKVANQIRRLTPMECERLQGFKDRFTEGVSDTQRYKQLGNAVTVNVIEEIARRLIKSISE